MVTHWQCCLKTFAQHREIKANFDVKNNNTTHCGINHFWIQTQPLQTTLCPSHYWNTSLPLLLLPKPIIFPFKNHLIALTCPWWQYAELHRVRWTKIPLSPRKGNIGGCHYNTVAMGCVSDSLALLSCAEDAFGLKNDWKYSDLDEIYTIGKLSPLYFQ